MHGAHHTAGSCRLPPRDHRHRCARGGGGSGRPRARRPGAAPALDALGSGAPLPALLPAGHGDEAELGPRFAWVTIALPDPLWHAAAAARASRRLRRILLHEQLPHRVGTAVASAVLVHDLIAFLPSARAQARAARIERPRSGRRSGVPRDSSATRARPRRTSFGCFRALTGRRPVIGFAAGQRFHNPPRGRSARGDPPAHGVERRDIVLASGTLEPRKNLLRLMRAHARLPETLRRRHPLLIVGPARMGGGGGLARCAAGATTCGSPGSCRTRTWPRCTAACPCSATRRSTRASACPCSRPWRPARRS